MNEEINPLIKKYTRGVHDISADLMADLLAKTIMMTQTDDEVTITFKKSDFAKIVKLTNTPFSELTMDEIQQILPIGTELNLFMYGSILDDRRTNGMGVYPKIMLHEDALTRLKPKTQPIKIIHHGIKQTKTVKPKYKVNYD